jgi:rod shape determining protein RodA
MKEILINLKKLDWVLIFSIFLLSIFGLFSIYSTSFSRGDFSNFKKQIFFLFLGFFLMLLFSFLDWRSLREETNLILFLYFLLLILLLGLYPFAPHIRGIKKWYKIWIFTFDPFEFLKIVLIILLAKFFSKKHVEIYRISPILLSAIYVFLPAILLFFQPDLGSVLILISLWIGMLIVSGMKIRHFLFLIFIFFIAFLFSWHFFLFDYQKARILNFLFPRDPLGVGWSQNQAKIAIGSGGIFGKGFKKGSQTQLLFLPEPQTDFIFAAIAEEFGLAGVSFLLFLFSLIILRLREIALNSKTNFQRLFVVGYSICLIVQVFINIGMNLGLLPIIGIPLPFVSYGGSSLISNFIGLGIVQSIKIY